MRADWGEIAVESAVFGYSGRPVVRVLTGPRDAVQSLAWSRDGRHLAAGEFERVYEELAG